MKDAVVDDDAEKAPNAAVGPVPASDNTAPVPDSQPKKRTPRWIFANGKEPDPRFSLANERTFLAWIRTAVALIAAAVAIHAVTLPIPDWVQVAVSIVLLAAGALIPVGAWLGRCVTERAMRVSDPLPNTVIAEAILAVTLIAVVVLFALGLSLE
jgi:putative membrane protein